jgi:hypothetical protein
MRYINKAIKNDEFIKIKWYMVYIVLAVKYYRL